MPKTLLWEAEGLDCASLTCPQLGVRPPGDVLQGLPNHVSSSELLLGNLQEKLG